MIVQTTHLSKHYPATHALSDCTLGVRSGEVFGLLGPNGAGKTTLLRLLMGYIKPTSGSATVVGFDCRSQSLEVRKHTAYLPGEARLFRRMNGRQVLSFFSRLRTGSHEQSAIRVADRLELDLTRQVARMSTGMRQKLALAAVLATDCELIVLDEPTANLDPTARAEVLTLVRESQAAGRTVIFSSHVLSEVEETCDRVVILRSGALVHEQSIALLRKRHRIRARLSGPFGTIPHELESRVSCISRTSDRIVLEASNELSPILGWLATLSIDEVTIEPVGLSAIYDQFHRSVGIATEIVNTPLHASSSDTFHHTHV